MYCVVIMHDGGFASADYMDYEFVKKLIGSEPKVGSQFEWREGYSESGLLECEVIAICSSACEAMNIAINAYNH